MRTSSSHWFVANALRTRPDLLAFLGLSGLWIVLVLVVDPRGNFPLLDDWSYSRSVKILVEEGRLYYDGWNSPTLFFQVLYGALFCLPFGFSFEALRFSTLVAGLAGGLGTYALLRQASAHRLVAVIGSLVVMLNPSYFQHSFTFMTDVPFAALAVISAVFFLRALRTGSIRDIVLGTVLASCATLIRQPGIAVPIGYCVALLGTNAIDKRVMLRAGLPLGVTISVLVVYNSIIDYLHMTPALSGATLQSILARLQTDGVMSLVLHVFKLGEALFAHIALFALPVLLILFGYRMRGHSLPSATRRWLLIFIFSPIFFLFLYWRFWPSALPVRIFSTAHSVMHGQRSWGASEELLLFREMLWLAEFAATVLIVVLVIGVVADLVKRHDSVTQSQATTVLFGVTTSVMLCAPFVFDGYFTERYLIPVIPFALLTLVALIKPIDSFRFKGKQVIPIACGMIIMTAYATISILYAHDYLLWNRVRSEAMDYLIHDQGIDPVRIDGGLSFNGWYLFPLDGPLRNRYINWRFESVGWWRNDNADFIIGFSNPNRDHSRSLPIATPESPREQSQIIWKKSYDGWLPGADGAIMICRGLECSKFFNVRQSSGKLRSQLLTSSSL